MESSDTTRQLDTVIALLKLAHRDDIERARDAIRSDIINAAVLDGARKWTPAAKLKTVVMKKTRAGSSTVADRIAELIAIGVLEKQGGGPTTEYRSTGLV